MNYHDYFTYLPENGALIHKRRSEDTGPNRSFNTRFADTYAGYLCNGVVYVNVKGMKGAHRIVWEMHHGPIPKGMVIDHINMKPWDNRLENLRLATKSQNGMNRGPDRRSWHGLKGVSQDKRDGAWQAEIRIDGKKISLGRHLTKGLAAVAYAKGAMRYHGKFARVTKNKTL